ncbi:MAG: UbiA family prenyltransferase [Acidobacteriia bacterium]|nr:UbiA family prenyltransferase [Terriglobia bacterium]
MTESPAPSVSRWAVYLRLGRISNLPTVWTNCLAGVFLAGVAPSAGTAAPLLLALSCFYTGGMLLNDAFDAGHDRKFRPERPIPAGQIAAGEVFAGGFALLGLGEAVLGMIGPLQGAAPSAMGLLSGLVLGALIVFYDAHHKNNVLSPLVMALCRAMVYVTVAATVLPAVAALVPPARLGWGMVALVCYLIGLTYVAKQENLQQIRNLWPLVFLATPFVYCAPALSEGPFAAALYLGFLAWVGYGLWFVMIPARRSIPRAVTVLIAGISLLDGVLMAGTGAPPAWLAATVAAWALTLFLQRFVSGT